MLFPLFHSFCYVFIGVFVTAHSRIIVLYFSLGYCCADSLVKITDINFAYDDRSILKGVTMDIPRGKLIAIMGNSGCGKTTLLRLIGGQLKPTSGTLLVDGESVPDMSHSELYAMRRRMGMLFQFGALFWIFRFLTTLLT